MRGVSAFQSTLPARGATSVSVTAVLVLAFQSTLPARGATRKDGKTVEADKISIHAPRTGSDAALQEIKAILLEISIHAPRTGSDHHWERVGMGADNFNPRSPHGERRISISVSGEYCKFQSTLPARGATQGRCKSPRRRVFQSTLPARGATRGRRGIPPRPHHFNPRSPHGERRITPARPPAPAPDFNPRSPHGERQGLPFTGDCVGGISIHAPRTGSDFGVGRHFGVPPNFNPRSPHGERRAGVMRPRAR